MIVQGEQVLFPRKAQRKPLDMLKALVAFGGQEVSRERLMDVLWPDAPGDAATRAFDTTLHRLRRLVGSERALVVQAGKLSLNPLYCWADTWAFEQLLRGLEATPKKEQGGVAAGDIRRLAGRAVALYRGPFLGDDDEPWAISTRERLRSQFTRCLLGLGTYWEQAEQWDKAADCYRQGLQADSLAELLHERLAVCYQRLGRPRG